MRRRRVLCTATLLVIGALSASACSSGRASITATSIDTTSSPTSTTVPASSAAAVSTAALTTTAPPGTRPTGFDTVEYVVQRADGTICRLCVYLARTAAQQERGLMQVTDLAGRDGMAFPFDPPAAQRLWMMDTVIPLTALWFDAEGRFLQRDDMDPCAPGATNCPVYGPEAKAALVIEFPVGRVDELRLGAGDRLELGWSAAPAGASGETCPLTD